MNIRLLGRISVICTLLAVSASGAAPPPPSEAPVLDKPTLGYVSEASPSWFAVSGELRFRFEGR